MTQLFKVHPDNPQPRLLNQVAQLLEKGALVACPTDSAYAVVARLDDKDAAMALRRLRGLDDRHHLTLLCANLAVIGQFAKVDNVQFRLLKSATPGPWTFILEAAKDVPRRVSHPSRKTVGIRVPDNPIVQTLIETVGTPLLSTTLIPQGEDMAMDDPEMIAQHYKGQIEAVLDGGYVPPHATTVVDLTTPDFKVLRVGAGNPSLIGLSVDD